MVRFPSRSLETSNKKTGCLPELPIPLRICSLQWPEILSEPDAPEILAAIRKHTRTGHPLGKAPFIAELDKIVSVSNISPVTLSCHYPRQSTQPKIST
jgi:hypothetical protein